MAVRILPLLRVTLQMIGLQSPRETFAMAGSSATSLKQDEGEAQHMEAAEGRAYPVTEASRKVARCGLALDPHFLGCSEFSCGGSVGLREGSEAVPCCKKAYLPGLVASESTVPKKKM